MNLVFVCLYFCIAVVSPPPIIRLFHRLDNLETELISSSTDPLSSTPDLLQHSDSEERPPRDHSHELRRAKSSASVKNLREMFESISTGTSTPDLAPLNKAGSDEEESNTKLPNGHLKQAAKSKSFSGALPLKLRDDPVEENKNEVMSPTICSKPKKGKKKKSGIAKKIERKMGSVKASKGNSNKIDSDAVLIGPGVDQSLVSDSLVVNQKKKSRFKLFKKKKSGSYSPNSSSPVLTSASESNLDDTASLIISNKSDPNTDSESLASAKPGTKKDPLYTISNPEYKAESQSPEDSLSDATSTSSFVRNSLARRTAPPGMHNSLKVSTSDDLVDSNSCRRVPSKIIQNLSREAVVLQTNSPEARSLLRNSFRNSKRGQNAGSVKQNLNFSEDSVSLPGTPKSSRVQISRASSQQALVNPSSDVSVSEAHLISKAYYSPKPKRAQKVRLDNVEMKETPATPQLAAEGTVVHRKSCSPLPQRSKKVRLSMTRKSPLNMSLEFSSDEEEVPPKRPELPENLDILLGTKPKEPKSSSENGPIKDVIEADSAPVPPVRKIPSRTSTPSTSPSMPNHSDALSPDTLASSLKSDGSESNSKSQLLSSSLVTSESSSAEVFETQLGSSYYRNFMYAKRIPTDPLEQKRVSVGQSSETSEYHTPGTHTSGLTSPSEETFHTPDQSFEGDRRASAPAVSIPAKRSSETVENGSSKRTSIGLEEIADKVFENIEETFKAASKSSPSHDGESFKTPIKSTEKAISRKSEPLLSNRANRVLNENMSPKDHSSINKILEKYRRIPTNHSSDTSKNKSVDSIRDKPKRSISERQAKLTANAARRSSASNPQQRVKVIHQLSNSFDKTIDRLVNKYYPKKDLSRNSSETSKETNSTARVSPSKETPSKDRKLSGTSTKEFQRTTSSDSPRRSSNYDSVKRHPSTPSRYYSYKSKSSSSEEKAGDSNLSGTAPGCNKTSQNAPAGTEKTENCVSEERMREAAPKTPTRSAASSRLTRETSITSPAKENCKNHNTPIKGTPKPRTLKSSASYGSFRSFNADKLRYSDSRLRRGQSQNVAGCDCRTVAHEPTCKKSSAGDKDQNSRAGEKDKNVRADMEDLENMAYIELSDTERLKQWDKTDYSKYLRSLRYQGRWDVLNI